MFRHWDDCQNVAWFAWFHLTVAANGNNFSRLFNHGDSKNEDTATKDRRIRKKNYMYMHAQIWCVVQYSLNRYLTVSHKLFLNAQLFKPACSRSAGVKHNLCLQCLHLCSFNSNALQFLLIASSWFYVTIWAVKMFCQVT